MIPEEDGVYITSDIRYYQCYPVWDGYGILETSESSQSGYHTFKLRRDNLGLPKKRLVFGM